MKISYCITVCDEDKEIQNLMTVMLENIDLNEDEIIILCDTKKTNDEVIRVCTEYSQKNGVVFIQDEFDNHFANWKNKFKEHASGDYIFQIDADEVPSSYLIKIIKEFILHNHNIELFWVPRENYVDGITEEHIIKWNMRVDQKERINFPDYQARLFKNLPYIKWKNKVHEIIVGTKKQAAIPAETKFCLLHEKTIERQEKQNNYYETL